MKVLGLIFGLLALSQAYHIDDAQVKIANELNKLIKNGATPRVMEDNIKQMIDEMLQPDPRQIDQLNLNVSLANETFVLLGSLSGVTLTGLSDHVYDQLEFSILPIGFKMEMTLNQISGIGTYDITGSIASLVPIYGAGPFDVQLQGVHFYLDVKLTSRDLHLVVKSLDLTLGVQSLSVKIDQLLGDLSDVINVVVTDILAEYIDRLFCDYGSTLTEQIVVMLNEFLSDKSLQDIIDIISGHTVAPTEASVATSPLPSKPLHHDISLTPKLPPTYNKGGIHQTIPLNKKWHFYIEE